MARNQQNNNSGSSWNDNHRYSNSDETIMRRGDDRTIESRNWGPQNERNSYRTDDYPTDKPMTRGNSQNMGSGNYGWSNDYRPSNDYRSSNDNRSTGDYRTSGSSRSNGTDRMSDYGSDNSGYGSSMYNSPSYDSSSAPTWQSPNNQGFDRSYGRQDNMYGQGGDLSNSQRTWGGGSTNFGSATSDTLRSGPHAGKGPKNYRRSDDRIKEDVSDALERHAHIDASELELEVKDGVVTFKGHVEDRRTKRMVEDAIEHVNGVRDVRNELTVDQSIFTQARNALFGETAESQSASSTNANRSTATKSKH